MVHILEHLLYSHRLQNHSNLIPTVISIDADDVKQLSSVLVKRLAWPINDGDLNNNGISIGLKSQPVDRDPTFLQR